MSLLDAGYMLSVGYAGHVVMRQQALARFAAERASEGPNPICYQRLSRSDYVEVRRQTAVELLRWTINRQRAMPRPRVP